MGGHSAEGGRQTPEYSPDKERHHNPRARESCEWTFTHPHTNKSENHDGGDSEIDPSNKPHQPERGFHRHGDAQRGFERSCYQLCKRDFPGHCPSSVSGEVEYVRPCRQHVEDEQIAIPKQIGIHMAYSSTF